MKSITFLMPPFQYSPVGGFKVALEYANRLAIDGYNVHIVYADATKYKNGLSFKLKMKLLIKHYLFKLKILHRSIRIWFPLDKRVEEHNVFKLKYHFVPKTDIYICTAVDTAPYLNEYPIESSRKFYFIQDYEKWGRRDSDVRQTYHFPMNKIVVSSWLKDILVQEEHEKCDIVPNGFDMSEYYLTLPIKFKNKYVISMLNHYDKRKGCSTSFSALNIVKQRYPQLEVNIFGTPARPASLPEWYHYYQSPSKEEHLRINNESAIYIAASVDEGWGLTIGEAMLCGQAVACTDNRGFREMAQDGITALLSPVNDAEALAKNIISLIEDDEKRYEIANNGMEFIKTLSIDNSYRLFKTALRLV